MNATSTLVKTMLLAKTTMDLILATVWRDGPDKIAKLVSFLH